MKRKAEKSTAGDWNEGNNNQVWMKILGVCSSIVLVLYWGFMAFDDFIDNMEWESKYNYVYLGEKADRGEYFWVKDWPEFSPDNLSDYIADGEKVINRRFVNLGLSYLEVSGKPDDYTMIDAEYEIVLPRFMYFPLFGTASFSYDDGDWGQGCAFGKEFGWMTKRNAGPQRTIQYPVSDQTVEKYRKIAMARPEWEEGTEIKLIFQPEKIAASYSSREWWEKIILEKNGVLQP